MGLAGLVWLAQGWVVGSEGFSPTMSNAIVLAEVVDVVLVRFDGSAAGASAATSNPAENTKKNLPAE